MATKQQVLDDIEARCTALRAQGGGKLPPERTLAEELGASRSTVRRALSELATIGAVTIRRGRAGGAVVEGGPRTGRERREERLLAVWSTDGGKVTRSLNNIDGTPHTLAGQGLAVGIRVLSLALEAPDPKIAERLGVDLAEPVVALIRIRVANEQALSLERMYLSYGRFPTLVEEGLGGATSMYLLLRERYGVSVAHVEEEIEIARATPREAALLTVETGAPVLVLHRLASDADGTPIECSFDLFRGDRTRLTVRTADANVTAKGNTLGVAPTPKE
jgi:GntR family transcriptional regulator